MDGRLAGADRIGSGGMTLSATCLLAEDSRALAAGDLDLIAAARDGVLRVYSSD